MTARADKLIADVSRVVNHALAVRDGVVVPSSETVFMNQAVKVQATYLYADMIGSSTAAQVLTKEAAAAVIRAFLIGASSIIRNNGGEIRSYDGDRVMGIFMGASKNTSAMKAALQINYAVLNVVRPALLARWSTFEQHYVMKHAVGVATGDAFVVKAGVHGNNDLVSIGAAPNVAAKLSDLRTGYATYLTRATYDNSDSSVQIGSNGNNMWTAHADASIGGKSFPVVASNWTWSP